MRKTGSRIAIFEDLPLVAQDPFPEVDRHKPRHGAAIQKAEREKGERAMRKSKLILAGLAMALAFGARPAKAGLDLNAVAAFLVCRVQDLASGAFIFPITWRTESCVDFDLPITVAP